MQRVVTASTFQGWLKDEEKLRQATAFFDESEGLQRKRLKQAKDLQLDKAVIAWFTQERSDGTPISGEIIKAQAQKLKKELEQQQGIGNSVADFQASNGWLSRFKKRHGICKDVGSGESRSADEYQNKLKALIEEGGYCPEQIYNCDETELCYQMVPDQTLARKSDESTRAELKDSRW